MSEATNETNPGCLEYSIIIALLIVIVPALLIANKLGWISDERLNELRGSFDNESERP